ncbi:syntabulin isoform X2 [Falco biarmicus]|uniref:syntabulin isoform X2 n=1 Tax=Falco rusticolus TaxID=120794 RepID=UPI00188669F5|nr:syntabulin isoform X2 [Falco rusticolus]XP_055560613.1 syntabulin isoform X2 [Falco cherrug]XP_055655363.1 syntabulin isoform X2 [Falco peregrinus]XP_056187314.1 syntabulin isoform X2 [Falco biarmicus]
MGPLRESSKEQKTQLEKEVSRSRIPRLVLRPQQKVSPASESPFSEEESREFNPPSSSGGSARTVSSNSFCSGSEADFSSSSSTGSISAPEVHMSAAGSKRSSFSRNRGPYGRNNGSLSYKSGASPPASREKDSLSTLCKNQLSPANIHQSYRASSASSSNSGSYKGSDSSPVMRRSGRYNSCADNHSIKPQNPEQYLTPLQQKEVTVRHLKTKLKESESKLKERETEIEELKAQLGRMREDWIEEECNRVEAELALKEARSEIKQLKQVIETMKNSLAEKDKKIQKYFIDINIQNKKLESLLQSMEMAQNGSARDEQCLEYVCDSEGKPLALCATVPDSLIAEDQALEEVADSGLLLNEDTANGSDSSEESLTTTASELSDPALSSSAVNKGMLENVLDEKLTSSQEEEKRSNMMVEQSVQTDVVPYSLDVEQLIQNIFRAQDACPLSPPSSLKELGDSLGSFSDSGIIVDLTPSDPTSAILLSPMESPCRKVEHRVNGNRFMKELDFTEPHDDEAFGYVNTFSQAGIKRRYWSRSLLRDVLAVAAPVVPTIMWAFSTQRGGTDPIYNIGALLRGCCLVALHSLRRTPFNIKT